MLCAMFYPRCKVHSTKDSKATTCANALLTSEKGGQLPCKGRNSSVLLFYSFSAVLLVFVQSSSEVPRRSRECGPEACTGGVCGRKESAGERRCHSTLPSLRGM